jgi:hypothetical protein
MTRRTDTLPDLSDLTGQIDAQGNPLYRRDLQDTPDPSRMQSMRDEIVRRIDSIPANAQTATDWDNPNKFGVSDLELFGPRDSFGLDEDQKRQAYQAVVEGRSRSDGVETLEHGHQLGGTGLESLSQADIDHLDRQDQEREQHAASLWNEFAARFPQLAADPEKVQVAIALHDDELRSYGQNPDVIRREDPIGYVKGVAEASRHVVESNGPDTRHIPASDDDGRTSSLSYGEGSRRSAPSRDKDDGDMIADLQAIQRRSGLW